MEKKYWFLLTIGTGLEVLNYYEPKDLHPNSFPEVYTIDQHSGIWFAEQINSSVFYRLKKKKESIYIGIANKKHNAFCLASQRGNISSKFKSKTKSKRENFLCACLFFFLTVLEPLLWHMELPRLGV